jgi:hypothetical protein
MISQNPADLIHKSQFRIWFEFGLIFHDIIVLIWKPFHMATLIGRIARCCSLGLWPFTLSGCEMIPIELIGLRSRSAYQLNAADPAPFGRGFASLGRLARKIARAISALNQRRLISQPDTHMKNWNRL